MSRTRLKSALLSALGYLEANQDDVSTIPILVEAYFAIAKAEECPVEQVLQDRGAAPVPSIANSVPIPSTEDSAEELEPEWDWAMRNAKELKQQGCNQVFVQVTIQDFNKFAIEVLTDPNTIACCYPSEGNTADLIAQVIDMVFEYCGIQVIETFNKSVDIECPNCGHEWTIKDPEEYDDYCPECEANCPADPVEFEVNLPDPNGEWHNIDYFSSHKEAIDYASEHFGADEDGWIKLVGRIDG